MKKETKLQRLDNALYPLQKRYAKAAMDKAMEVFGVESLRNHVLRRVIMHTVTDVGFPVAFEVAKRRL